MVSVCSCSSITSLFQVCCTTYCANNKWHEFCNSIGKVRRYTKQIFFYSFRVNHVYHIWLGFYDTPIGTISFHNDKSKFMFAFMYLEDLSNPVTIITVVMGKMMKCIAAMCGSSHPYTLNLVEIHAWMERHLMTFEWEQVILPRQLFSSHMCMSYVCMPVVWPNCEER